VIENGIEKRQSSSLLHTLTSSSTDWEYAPPVMNEDKFILRIFVPSFFEKIITSWKSYHCVYYDSLLEICRLVEYSVYGNIGQGLHQCRKGVYGNDQWLGKHPPYVTEYQWQFARRASAENWHDGSRVVSLSYGSVIIFCINHVRKQKHISVFVASICLNLYSSATRVLANRVS
jgi:hypothetical protein